MRVNAGELSVLSAKPRFEIYLALIIVGVSLLFPGAGYRDALFQLVFVSVILVAQHFPLAVFVPIPVASIIWASGYVDQWQLAPIIVYVAVHVISFRVGVMAAVVVSCEWIILAYIISVQSFELEAWFYSLILESFLLAFLIFIGKTGETESLRSIRPAKRGNKRRRSSLRISISICMTASPGN